MVTGKAATFDLMKYVAAPVVLITSRGNLPFGGR
jgi:hypothetical protein